MIDRDTLNGLAECQAAVLSRAQLLRYGVTEDAIAWRVTSKRWRTLHPGVYLTSPGRRDWDVTAWGALLVSGPGAVLSHDSAALSHGLSARAPEVVDVLIPHRREATPRPGVRVHRCRDHALRIDPDELVVPRTRLRDTVLDVADRLDSAQEVLALVTDACRRGLTYEEELRTALAARRTHRWRAVLREAIAESDDGAESVLEAEWLRRVVRPHGLPEGVAQLERTGVRRRHDRAYPQLRVLVELQGLAFHGSARAVVRTDGGCASRLPTGGSRCRSSGSTSTSRRARPRSSWRPCCAGTGGQGAREGAGRGAARPRSTPRGRDPPRHDPGDPAHDGGKGPGPPRPRPLCPVRHVPWPPRPGRRQTPSIVLHRASQRESTRRSARGTGAQRTADAA